MGNRVTTPNLRFEWVDGQVTSGTPDEGFVACGDGTAFPMEVTIDQIAEIFYRVKDAWFTGGSASWKVTGSPVSISAPTAAPTNRRLDVSASTYQQRGYCKLGGDDYNGATYNSGIASYYSDIADNENGMWRDAWNDPDHVDAFSFEQDDFNGTQSSNSQWWGTPDIGFGVYAKVFRGKRVAVVKADPADGLYAPTNQFFLEIEMYWGDYYPVPFGGGTNIYNSEGGFGDWSAYAVAICQYILRLESGDATCQVYFATDPSTTDETGTDFIHEPQVWWPYAKDNPAVPVWGIGNGAKL
jgi:hypothetical protein